MDTELTKCDECELPATHNAQETWVHYKVDSAGMYDDGEILGETGGNNYHFCDKHYDKWEEGGE